MSRSKDLDTGRSGTANAVPSTALFALCETWERDGKSLIQQASTADTWERDGVLREGGRTLICCAKQIRELISANG